MRVKMLLVLAFLAAGASELVAYAGVLLVSRRIRPRLVWTPDVALFEREYPEYLRMHHPVLGWPAPNDPRHDATGARPAPAFPNNEPACVALFGDSFTYGAEVEDDEAWGNLLAQRLNCRVANYGVGGYGTDQAFLRFRDRADDRAPIVILGVFEDNAQRNVNRYRELLAGAPSFSFKPRFALNDRGELALLPMALPAPEDARDFIESPERFLTDEHFLPGSREGPVGPDFRF